MGTVSNYSTSAGRRWRVRYRTPDHRQADKRGFRTKREAEDFLAGVEVAKLRADWVNPARSRVTVGEWAEQWYAAQLQVNRPPDRAIGTRSTNTSCRAGRRSASPKYATPTFKPG